MDGNSNCYASNKNQPQDEVLVITVPFPSQGHLNQLLHFSHLITSYGLPVHYVGSSQHNHQAKHRLHGWNNPETSNEIHFNNLPLPPYDSPPPKPDNSVRFPTHLQPLLDTYLQLRQPVYQLVQQLSTKFRRVVVIHDSLMSSVVQDVKQIQNAETYVFYPVSAFLLFSNVWETIEQKPFSLDDGILEKVPGLDECYLTEMMNLMNYQYECMGFESGKLFNTSKVIDGKYIRLLEKLEQKDDKEINHFFAVGPLNPVETKHKNGEIRHECLRWLDKQEVDSVVYVSFGSTISMTDEQIVELALGLEKSEIKFIWVLRRADTGDITKCGADVKEPELPEGYEERLKSKGLVVREWAPQLEILGHSSVGGFMSHCGWNSCMESISMGVPIMAWPMHTDQPGNAVLVTDVLRTGTLVRDWRHRDEVVSSGVIEGVVRRMMSSTEGERMRKRAVELGDVVRASVAKDGDSRLDMDSYISHITR